MLRKPTNLLVWKPKATFWMSLFFLLFGLLALSVFYFESTKSLFDWIFFILYVAWTAIALFGTVYGLRTRVEADKTGFRWRDWRGVWRAAKWDEISDFCKRSRTNENGSTHTIETAQGNFEFGLEGDGKAIAEAVTQRAINAPVREWEIKGERLTDEWPRRFEFYQPGLEVAARNCLLVLLAVVGWTVWLLFRAQPRADLPLGSWFLAYAAPFLVIPILPALIWLFLFSSARQARPFRGQSVEVSPGGLVWSGANRVETAWPDQKFHFIRRGGTRFLRLETASGVIEIPTFVAGFGSLCRIIERFSGVPLVKAAGEEQMATYSVQTAPDDTLIFGFSLVDSTLMRWLFPTIGIAMCCMPFLMHLADPQYLPRDGTPVVVIGVLLLLFSLTFDWCLRHAQLRLTRDGLEWRGPFLHRVVSWQDIESFGSKTDGSSWIVAAGRKVSLSWMLTTVAQRSQLRAEIEKRAFNAAGEWQEKPTQNR